MKTETEKKNERIAMLTSIGVHAGLFLLFFFLVAWRAPNPPLPEFGIELNFGTDDRGAGEVQPETPVGSNGTQQEEPEQPLPVEEEPQEEPTPTPAEESKPIEEETTSKIESPVKVEEKKKEEVKPDVKEPETPKEKIIEPKKEEVKPKPEEVKPKVNEDAVYKPKSQNTESANKTTEGKEGQQASQGDKGKTGDQGNPEGTLDAKALYGQQGGGGGGVSHSGLNGFEWPNIPTPALPEEAYGVYEFVLKVDEDGNVLLVTTVKRGLSIEAEKRMKDVIQKLQFTPQGSNLPPVSEGRITWKVVAK